MTAGLFRETPLSWAIYTDLSLSLYFVCDGLPQGHLSLEACWRGICCQKDHLHGRSWAVRRPSSLKLSKCQRVEKWASNWRIVFPADYEQRDRCVFFFFVFFFTQTTLFATKKKVGFLFFFLLKVQVSTCPRANNPTCILIGQFGLVHGITT